MSDLAGCYSTPLFLGHWNFSGSYVLVTSWIIFVELLFLRLRDHFRLISEQIRNSGSYILSPQTPFTCELPWLVWWSHHYPNSNQLLRRLSICLSLFSCQLRLSWTLEWLPFVRYSIWFLSLSFSGSLIFCQTFWKLFDLIHPLWSVHMSLQVNYLTV